MSYYSEISRGWYYSSVDPKRFGLVLFQPTLGNHETLLMDNIRRSPVEGKVVYPSIYRVLCISRGCLGFLNHRQ